MKSPSPANGSSDALNTRRQFLKQSSAAMGGVLAMPYLMPSRANGAEGDIVRIGLVGCGGRGTGAANEAMTTGRNVELVAMGDVFENQLRNSLATLTEQKRDQVKVDSDRQFIGLDAYQQVIDSGVDAVLLTTPPGFRPLHLKAAVAAGKHVFCEKPMATDAPGVRSVLASAEEAKRKNLALVAGFCWRYNQERRAFYEQVHNGALGDIRALYSTFYTGPVKQMPPDSARRPEWSDVEWQVRNWYNFTWLSGDGLVEQAVHSVDKIAWAMRDVAPLKAVAVGGRQIPNHSGNIYDHIEVNYEYPDDVRAFLGCRQQTGCYSENNDYLMGTRGVGTIGRRPTTAIRGGTDWQYRGPTNNMYQAEHDELFASIRSGQPINDGVRMAHSTLMAIMGRMAAYTGQEITWDMALNSEEKLVPEPLTWDMPLEIRPMAMPGRTRFV